MLRRFGTASLLLIVVVLSAGCAAGRAFRQGDEALKTGNLDEAVAHYRRASQADPDNADYQIALQRAMLAASRSHLEKARSFEALDQLEAARGEYSLASEYDPSNRNAAGKVRDLDRLIRERMEAARPRPFEEMQARARASSPVPLLDPTSRDPITIAVVNQPVRDIVTAVSNSAGIDVLFDRDADQVLNRTTSIDVQGLTLEQALNYLMGANQLSYKIISPRTILVFQDVANKHLQYDDQVIQTFPISHADPAQLVGVISAIVRIQGLGIVPLVQANPTNGTIVAKATVPIMQIIAKIIEQNDKPPAEVVIDVEILEVNRTRAKTYGLNLADYTVQGVYSPDAAPGFNDSGTLVGPPFNANSLRNVGLSDFYLSVPTAIVRALASDQHTKLLAKPQLRGAEGKKLSVRLGDKVPIATTTFTPLATGGASTNPLTTFNQQDVGINLDITPRVTVDGDIVLDVFIESSALGADIVVNGVSQPIIGTRSVTTLLRLRDGESNLIAGLLREDERKFVQGFPGLIRVPFFRQLFSANDNEISQTDIVMLLTPHIVRGKEITEEDLRPIYIGSGQNLGLNGPPPLIAPPGNGGPANGTLPPAPGAPGPGTPVPPPLGTPTPTPPPGAGGTLIVPPPGSSPIPGTLAVPVPSTPPVTTGPPTTPGSATVPPSFTPAPLTPAPTAAAPVPPASPTTPAPTSPSAAGASEPVRTSGVGSAQVTLTPPGTALRVGGGPYTIPIAVSNASRLTTVTLTVTFDPTKLRVRSVQEGSFMRAGGVNATFTQNAGSGRVDITITRPGDTVGASGTGLLGAILFDAIAPGSATLNMNGVATGPGGAAMGLQLRPVTISIEQ